MRSLRLSFIATSAVIFVTPAQAGVQSSAQAGAQSPAATITHLSGPLLAQKSDGRTRVLAQGAAIDVGDTIVTGNGTYAEIHFADDSDAILQPDTTLTVDAFSRDSARWTLAQGGMQVTSGVIAASGARHHMIETTLGTIAVNRSKFTVTVTPGASPVALSRRVYLAQNDTSTISDVAAPIIVATTFINQYVPPPPPTGTGSTSTPPQGKAPAGVTPPALPGSGTGPQGSPVLSPGLHLQVTDGAIVVTNNGGSLGFQAGQFGYVPSVNQPPVIVPSNPNIQFVPPPSFGTGSGGPTASNGPGQGQATDCIVR